MYKRQYQGSNLEQLINGCWEKEGNIQRYYWEDLEALTKEEQDILKDKIKQKLTIVTPDPNLDKKGQLKIFGKQNYNTQLAFDLGCHFISVYYQSLDKYMDSYITKFREQCILLKPKSLQIGYKDTVEKTEESKSSKKNTYQEYRNKLEDASEYLKNIEDF